MTVFLLRGEEILGNFSKGCTINPVYFVKNDVIKKCMASKSNKA